MSHVEKDFSLSSTDAVCSDSGVFFYLTSGSDGKLSMSILLRRMKGMREALSVAQSSTNWIIRLFA